MGKKTGKIKWLFNEIKTHWHTPAEGKYVPYKEYKDIFLAVGSNYTAAKTLHYISFSAACYLIMHHYKLPYLTFSVIAILNLPLGYTSSLMAWLVNDNLGFLPKKTEKKFYLAYGLMIIFGISSIIFDFSKLFNQTGALITKLNSFEGMNATACFKTFGTGFLTTGWIGARSIFWRKKLLPKYGRYKYSLYCDVVPKCVMVVLVGWLPVYNIPDVATRVWVANLLFGVYNIFSFGNNLETCTNTISPNLQERILVRTYPVKLSHFIQSLTVIILPAMIGALRYKWADINMYRYIIPGTFILFAIITMFFAGRIKERIPQPPVEQKAQIKFWDGMFGVLRNKYHRINTVVGLIDSLGNGMLPFATILYLFTFRLSGLPYSLLVSIISFAGTPPDLCAPYFLKRFSYKQIMIFYQLTRGIGTLLLAATMWFFRNNVALGGTICFIILFIMETIRTVPATASRDMAVRIGDYQMYLSGERLESFTGVFGWFTGPITSFISLIIPLMLLKYGFNSNWDVLFIDDSRIYIIIIPLIIDAIGFFLMTIPYLFWDYDSKKQNMVMEVLKRRAEVTEKQAQEEGLTVSGGYKG